MKIMSSLPLSQLATKQFTLNPLFAEGEGRSASGFSAMGITPAQAGSGAADISGPASDPADPIEESYLRGLAEGSAQAKAEYDAENQSRKVHIAALDNAFTKAVDNETRVLGQKLQQMVLALCEQAMAPLALDKDALVHRIEAASALLMRAQDERQVRLHPDDLALVKDAVPEGLALVADGSLERGALRIETTDGGIEDGPATWHSALQEALGLC